jgi:hypothetical protein
VLKTDELYDSDLTDQAWALVAPVHGEFINHAAIGVWYSPRQGFSQRYEANA